MKRVIALVFVVAVFVSAALAPVAGAQPGKNPPKGNGPGMNPSPQTPTGTPSDNGLAAKGWAVGHRRECGPPEC
jgi:hypothetical protein